MFGRLGRDAGSVLGVEFAPGCVRMLQLERRRGQARVKAWASQALAGVPGDAACEHDSSSLLQALGQAHRRCATGHRQVALALPSAQVICKRCPMPADLSLQQVEAWLLAEADRLFPFPLDDLALDFQVLRPATEPGLVEVLVAACRQSQLDPFEQLLARAGLQLVAMDLDSFALRRALVASEHGGALLLQLEAGSAVLHGCSDDRLPYAQRIALDGPESRLDALTGPLRRALQPGDQLLLAGGAASPCEALQLGERLGCRCRLLELPTVPGLGEAPGASMALAYGLALGAWQ